MLVKLNINSQSDERDIEELKAEFRHKTASRACLQAIRTFMPVLRRRDELEREVARLEHKLKEVTGERDILRRDWRKALGLTPDHNEEVV